MSQINLNRMEHVAVVVEDLDRKAEELRRILGMKSVPTLDWKISEYLDSNPIDLYTLRVAFFKMENIVLELMQVVEGKSFYDNFTAKAGQGIHQVCFDVENIKEEIEKFEKLGVKISQSGKFAGSSFAYLDTVESLGFHLEMLQKRTRTRKKSKPK